MADRKISDLTALTTPATGDLLPIVDVSEAAAADKNKSITVQELFKGVPDGTAAAPGLAFESDDGNGMFLGGTDILAFSTGGTQAVTIDASQRLGVGTTTVSDKLHVDAGNITLSYDGSSTGLRNKLSWRTESPHFDEQAYIAADRTASSGAPTDIVFATAASAGAATEKVRIDSSGNVGIGASSPDSTLELASGPPSLKLTRNTTASTGNDFGRILFENSAGTTLGSIRGYSESGNTDLGLKFSTGTGDTVALTIDESQRLGVGTSSPSEKLGIAGNLQFEINDGVTIGARESLSINLNSSGGQSNRVFQVKDNGTSRFTIEQAGNVGIGTSSPVADFVVSNGGADGIELQPNIVANTNRITNYDRNGGSYSNFRLDAAQQEFLISGSEKARIDSSGRLLVGSTSYSGNATIVAQGHSGASTGPAHVLLKLGNNAPASGGDLGYLFFSDSNSSGGFASWILGQRDGGTWTSGSSMPGRLVFSTTADGSSSPTERMRIQADGTVKIGTGSGNPILMLNASTSGTSVIQMGDSADSNIGQIQYANSDDSMRFFANNSERMRIDSSGRLLVGTSSGSGSGVLIVQGGAGTPTADAVMTLRRGNNNPTSGVQGLGQIRFEDLSGGYGAQISALSDGTWSTTTDCPTALLFSTTADSASSPTERMRIDQAGRIMLGGGATGQNGSLEVRPNNSFGAPTVRWDRNPTTDGSTAAVFANNNNTVGSITYGDSSTSFNTSSDYRLKENVVDLEGAITRVKLLAPKRFNFIVNAEKTVDGFLAHEAQVVVPEAVTGTHNEVDDDGNAVMQGIDQSKLVPLLTAALQEAIAKIETLEAKVAALEAT